jgi:hypothetical protein
MPTPDPTPEPVKIALEHTGAVFIQPLQHGVGLTVQSDDHHGGTAFASAYLTPREVLAVIAALAGGRA